MEQEEELVRVLSPVRHRGLYTRTQRRKWRAMKRKEKGEVEDEEKNRKNNNTDDDDTQEDEGDEERWEKVS